MWIVVFDIEYDSGIEVFETYEEAKERFDEIHNDESRSDIAYLAEVKASKKF